MLETTLPAAPRSIPTARRALDHLELRVPDDVRENLRLLVSELVTNCIRHGRLSTRDSIRLSVGATKKHVRVAVSNPGPGFEPPSIPPSLFQESGWGLYLVSRLADRWGVETNGETVVWFELDCR